MYYNITTKCNVCTSAFFICFIISLITRHGSAGALHGTRRRHDPTCPPVQVMSTAAPCTTAWEEVGLSALRPSLDEQALAIAEHQESSLESRRALAAQAKSFRLAVEAEFGATSDMRTSSGALVRHVLPNRAIAMKKCYTWYRRPIVLSASSTSSASRRSRHCIDILRSLSAGSGQSRGQTAVSCMYQVASSVAIELVVP